MSARDGAGLDRQMAEARALVEAGLADGIQIQDGKVYVHGACAGCGRVALNIIDVPNAGNPWCPGCGGRSLVALDVTDPGEFENGLCRLGTSAVIHLVAPPYGEHPVCLRGSKVGRMKPVVGVDEPTCQRCIAERDGMAAYGHGPAAPARRTPGTR